MFEVNGYTLLVPEVQVIEDLRTELLLNGRELFATTKILTDDIMTPCPFHKDGKEKRASFGISKVNMKCNCFACGWGGNLYTLISELYGYLDNGEYGKRWLISRYIGSNPTERQKLILPLNNAREVIPKIKAFEEAELAAYRFIHPYHYERGLTLELLEEFDIGYDEVTDCITFPVYDELGEPVFIARRSVKTKYFSIPPDIVKPVYALEKIMQKKLFKEVVICEAVLDALICWKYNIPAVALFGTGTPYQIELLRRSPIRKFIIGLDGDAAGQRGAEKIIKALKSTKIMTAFDIPSGKDLNKLDENVPNLSQFFCI